ncbi:MAG: hypothetical protein ACE14P_10600 [Methanotrichaceae archaeon]
MSYIKHPILILPLLMLTIALTYSQMPIRLDGSNGLSILNGLTESPPNQTNNSLNGSNNTTNLNEIKGMSSSDFWSWGTRPKNYSEYGTAETDYLSDPITDLSATDL